MMEARKAILCQHIAVAVLITLLCSERAPAAQNEAADRPMLPVPVTDAKPVIDGKVDDAEWQGAFSQRALRTVRGQISTRQARFWMMWDEENIYVAMRSPFRKGERPVQQHRDPSADTDQIFDDCYEIWVSAGQVGL